ncbi:hypothetical protein AHF37_04537 [Paragonimus kellicotti]|nr:hypothetical protein AHF37_04537 [Paragonimus kellicotti]
MTNLSDDFADRIHDELLGVHFFPSTQDDSSERLSAEVLVREYKKFCQRRRIRVRDPVVTRIRSVCHHLLFDLRELDLSSQEFEAIVHILQSTGTNFEKILITISGRTPQTLYDSINVYCNSFSQQDCARIANINLSFNRIENKGIKLLRPVVTNSPFLTQLILITISGRTPQTLYDSINVYCNSFSQQDCARIANINLSFNRIENKGIKLLRPVVTNSPFLTQLVSLSWLLL